jgi:dihydroorotate dehydrogenase (fumarate)
MLSHLIAEDLPPLMNAAGTAKTVSQLRELLELPIAAVVVGSYTREERSGNQGQVFFAADLGSLNTLGLPGPALEVWTRWLPEMRRLAHQSGKPLWVSVAGFNPYEYRVLVESALEGGADVIEVNLGCPNVWEGGNQKSVVSYSAEETRGVLAEIALVASSDTPIGLKLSPIFDPTLLESVDAAIRDAGYVSFITTTNTIPNCFALATDGTPGIGFGKHLGGMGGPAAKWIGQGQVVQHRELLPEVPIVGVGGISSGRDLHEYLSEPVGASACQVGTAYWQRGPRAFAQIIQEYVEETPDPR